MKRVIKSTRGLPGDLCRGFSAGVAAILAVGVASGPLLLSQANVFADTEEVTETTQSMGTISEFSPDSIVIRTERSSQPVPFSYSKTTTYVDETGAPVARETIRSGVPVTVYYTRDEGGHMMATRVVVRKAAPPSNVIERKTTTTTTTEEDR